MQVSAVKLEWVRLVREVVRVRCGAVAAAVRGGRAGWAAVR